MSTTMLSDLINPQVMADMITAKVSKKIVVTPFARLDATLAGQPGDTVTVPSYAYIGDAEDVAEGVACGTVKLATSTKTFTIKKAMKAVEITDEAVLSGYGNPVGETNNQLAKAIASKVDNDAIAALKDAQLVYDGSAAIIGYNPIVEAVDIFDEEVQSDKVMFVNPKQLTQLRKDANFISADKYNNSVIMNGEIGMIAGTRIVPSKKVTGNEAVAAHYVFCQSTDTGAKKCVAASPGSDEILLTTVQATLAAAKVDDYVKQISAVSANTYYECPIIKLENDAETEDEAAALTIFLKRETNVETDRVSLARKTDISADRIYGVALTNQSKVVMAHIKM
ncbi:major capsid protein, N4-gp56 family [Eubacterium aggregans]|uniref:Major capsid protein, N4-gp56 family n=1 Tax=Eubacterium aggregans TaxID=81409 RepID=A0A1H3YW96_9FIRM|nr:N4-gp56 family major capsid protein [Eubacterium aggregans]SEA15776.1 major capsid protein, N4-gp56 family [Eubacterium aggregans]